MNDSSDFLPDSLKQLNVCRLCLKYDKDSKNIFDEPLLNDSNNKSFIDEIFDLVNIKYTKSSVLPNQICGVCLLAVKTFTNFRENTQKNEEELQDRLTKNQIDCPVYQPRPGLNGNPGTFVPDENCTIIEIDPNIEFESSEDDFSLESDSETENIAPDLSKLILPPSVSPQAQQKEIKMSSPLTPTAISLPYAQHIPNPEPNVALTENISLDYAHKNTFLCQYCDVAFTSQKECADHEKSHDISSPYACNFCPLRTSNRQTLITHIRGQHDSERPYICPLCSKGFGRRSDLKKHTIVHTGVRPFTCHICSKSFSRNTNLTKHMRIHSSLKPHVCQSCPRSFPTAAELSRHTRTHTEMKAHPCDRCNASFSRRDKLVLHQQGHLRRDSEISSLNQPKKGLALTNSLVSGNGQLQEQHNADNIINIHGNHGNENDIQTSNEDPCRSSILAAQLLQRSKPSSAQPKQHSRNYTCEVCAKSFTRDRDLQRHRALHLDQLFKCNQCGLDFNRQEKLKRHEQEFHGPQYPCKYCIMTFHKHESLEMHLKMHELQQNSAQAAINAASGGSSATVTSSLATVPIAPFAAAVQNSRDAPPSIKPPTIADMSFYSQMVPTMNLGFYSETRPEDRNNV